MWWLIGSVPDFNAVGLRFESHYWLTLFSFMAVSMQNLGLIKVKESRITQIRTFSHIWDYCSLYQLASAANFHTVLMMRDIEGTFHDS